MDENDAKDMSGVILQGFLDEGDMEKAKEVVENLAYRFDIPEPVSGFPLGLVLGGFVVGAGVGGALGVIFTRRQLETKYAQISAEEIAEMREHYREKATALEAQTGKGDLESIVRERGYVSESDEEEESSATPPMAVTPPAAVVEAAEETKDEKDEDVETPPDPEEDPEPEVRNIFADNPPPEDEWDWAKERAQRSPLRPYVIHLEERDESDAHDVVTWTYYESDDVVCNERDDVISPEDRERIVGEANLEKFGHGSGDSTTVYIRNNQLEMDVEVIRSPNSYAQEVHGFEPEIKHSDHRERKRFDDE